MSTPSPPHTQPPNITQKVLNEEAGEFTLLLFASASTYTNHDSLTLPAPTTLSKLFELLESKFPGIGKKVLQSCAVTINLEYVDCEYDFDRVSEKSQTGDIADRLVIRKGDEIGIIPPVSSG